MGKIRKKNVTLHEISKNKNEKRRMITITAIRMAKAFVFVFVEKNDIKDNGKRTERADKAQRELLRMV